MEQVMISLSEMRLYAVHCCIRLDVIHFIVMFKLITMHLLSFLKFQLKAQNFKINDFNGVTLVLYNIILTWPTTIGTNIDLS